uniref:Transposon Ty3-G Gag-Pol polyprotein n=1 Tax=Cajanus cajan TaxID=3821 RepID=A0A151SQY0_CAJCA|nr:Transposon Ty3-G Gag-Pol polyprotein [Cajanus cajan]
MPGIDANFICHRLAIHKEAKPVAQRKRKVGGKRREAIITKTQKLLNAGFIREGRYTTWLANVVLVKKSSGKWRMCVDYTDLNKACPKDSYPLPSIDRLRLMDKVFHQQIGRNMEVYVDDMVGKTTSAADHAADLAGVFSQIRRHNLRLNPEKCKAIIQIGRNCNRCGHSAGAPKNIDAGLLHQPSPPRHGEEVPEIHRGICGMHSGARSMATRVLRVGYYWPTLKSDCRDYVQKCKECQQFGNSHRVKHLLTSVEHPQTNGQAEAANKVIF